MNSFFKKCSITVNLDGAEDHAINIADLSNYRGPSITSFNSLPPATVVDSGAIERQFDSESDLYSDSESGSATCIFHEGDIDMGSAQYITAEEAEAAEEAKRQLADASISGVRLGEEIID